MAQHTLIIEVPDNMEPLTALKVMEWAVEDANREHGFIAGRVEIKEHHFERLIEEPEQVF